ncbi:MAG: hypothetical protein NVSMB25_23670 [Thermoleophilaceae bacterium]
MIRRLTAALVVVAACAAAALMSGAGGGSESGKTVKMAFDNAFGLTQGGDLRVAGVKAGQTTKFEVSKGPECQNGHPQTKPARVCAVVTGEVSQPGLGSFRTDVHCDIRQQSLIGEYYVDCQPGNAQQDLPKDRIVPDTQTTSTIPADLVNNVLRRPYRERLRLIIGELGTGLAGRSQDLSDLLHRAHPGLRQTDQVLRILANQQTIIKNFISNSNTVVTALDRKKQDVARWISEAGRTADISASRSQAIQAGFQRLPTFLDELKPTMARLADLTDQQTPLLRDLQRAAPSLTEFFTRLGPFSEASRPAFKSLGQTAVIGNQAFRASQRDIDELRALAADAPATAKPLRQFLQTLDNRKRTADPDVRAAQTAPPAPDPTKFSPGQGFTGFESLLNYAYWQVLAINEFDSLGHFLRVVLIEDPKCSAYQTDLRPASMGGTDPSADATRAACNSYLGPYQPGVTQPDPTARGSYAKVTGPTAPKTIGERRVAGQPPAAALPGQTDYSQPHPTLPPSVQQVLNQTGTAAASPQSRASAPQAAPSSTQAPSPATTQQALDYLLAP